MGMKWAFLILLIVVFSVCFIGRAIHGQGKLAVSGKTFRFMCNVIFTDNEKKINRNPHQMGTSDV